MAKVKQRKDSKGRVLQTGETQRKTDGMYIYRYVDPYGKRCYVYSKDLFTLREKEQKLIRDQMDGLDTYVGGHATINMAFDRYMSTKYNLRETTRSNYIYMFNKFVRDEFGNKKIVDVKYTEVQAGALVKTGNETDSTVYADWYKAVYMPTITGVNTNVE